MAESNSYGPALPPGFRRDNDSGQETEVKPETIGPALPPGFVKDSSGNCESANRSSNRDSTYGPTLPPTQTLHSHDDVLREQMIGPSVPPDYTSTGYSGSAGLAGESDEDDADVIGPMPHAGPSCASVEHEIDARARKMKDKIANKNKPEKALQRESWMTEIPTELGQNLGIASIAPRKLGSGKAKVDTSAWTETPAEREKREQEEKEGKRRKKRNHDEEEVRHMSKRDQELAKQVNEHNKSKRAESLLEMHSKKMKKEKKKKKKKDKEKGKSDKPERKPFNRDEDLKISQMDAAQKKALIKRSQQLNSKFGHGSTQFL